MTIPGLRFAMWVALGLITALFGTSVFALDIAELVEEKAIFEFKGAFPDRGRFDVRLADGSLREAEFLSEFWRDTLTGKFIANAVTDTGDVRRVWGVAALTVPVPVPTRRLLPDEIIGDGDLEIIRLPYARLNAFAVLEHADLAGMQVRRMLVPGRPVIRHSVIPPTVIMRGEIVKIELTYGALKLVAKGKSMSDAHLGQQVRVVNLSSNKTISAVALAKGTVGVER